MQELVTFNRANYFNFIEGCLSYLVTRIKLRCGVNLLDLNLHSESFYNDLLNLLHDWKLKNANTIDINAKGIDLIDNEKKIIIQVSSTTNKEKIQKSLSKSKDYVGYSFKFLSIIEDSSKLRSSRIKYIVPDGVLFNQTDDIWDVKTIVREMQNIEINILYKIYMYFMKNFSMPVDKNKITTNLASIVNDIYNFGLISESEKQNKKEEKKKIPYDIPRKIIYNNLKISTRLIDRNKYYHHRLNAIYTSSDAQGKNKSSSVFSYLEDVYCKLILKGPNSSDEIFFEIINCVVDKVRNSENHQAMPDEELLMYVHIIVVDAFIRCVIFENPNKEDKDASS